MGFVIFTLSIFIKVSMQCIQSDNSGTCKIELCLFFFLDKKKYIRDTLSSTAHPHIVVDREMVTSLIFFIFWYCRALVEVKPVLYVEDYMKTTETTVEDMSFTIAPNHWDFQEASWHDTCIQKSVIPGKICVIVLSVTNELAMKVCSESPGCNRNNQDHRFGNEQIDRITRFCIYLLDKVLAGNGFSWEDITVSVLNEPIISWMWFFLDFYQI